MKVSDVNAFSISKASLIPTMQRMLKGPNPQWLGHPCRAVLFVGADPNAFQIPTIASNMSVGKGASQLVLKVASIWGHSAARVPT